MFALQRHWDFMCKQFIAEACGQSVFERERELSKRFWICLWWEWERVPRNCGSGAEVWWERRAQEILGLLQKFGATERVQRNCGYTIVQVEEDLLELVLTEGSYWEPQRSISPGLTKRGAWRQSWALRWPKAEGRILCVMVWCSQNNCNCWCSWGS